jgi:alkylation response protein AidB-like acyl-CoA dehydrogenase
MQFTASDSHRDLLEAVRAVVGKSLAPSAAERDRSGLTMAKTLQTLRDLGLFALDAPESDGGLALDAVGVVRVLALVAETDAGLAQLVAENLAAAWVLRRAGRQAPAVLLCLAHGEDTSHLDAPLVRTAVLDATTVNPLSTVVISGRKPMVLAGALAQVVLVSAQTADGIGLFQLDLDKPGVERALHSDLLGLRAAGVAEVEFDSASATALCTGDLASSILREVELRLRLWTAAVAVGCGRGALQATAGYVQQREQFGKPIAVFQPVQWQIANSVTELDAAWMLVGQAAGRLDTGAKTVGRDIALAKAKACEAAFATADRAIQLHGGYGYTADYPVERAYRDAAVLQLIHGTPSACKVEAARWLAAA